MVTWVPAATAESSAAAAAWVSRLHWQFASALVWGLNNPEHAADAFAREQAEDEIVLSRAIAAGLQVDAASVAITDEDIVSELEAIVAGYEEAIGALPRIPESLEQHQRIRRRLETGA